MTSCTTVFFFAKINDGEHRTDLNPNKGGKEGLDFLEMLKPEEYIHPKLRGDVDRTYTDEKGKVQGFENTNEGFEVVLTDLRLAADKKYGNTAKIIINRRVASL